MVGAPLLLSVFSKPNLYLWGGIAAVVAALGGYAYATSLRLDAAKASLTLAQERLSTAERDLTAAREERDKQAAALARQIETAREIMGRSADIMRVVRNAPPSTSCAASSRVDAYLGELRRRSAGQGVSPGGTDTVRR